MSFSQNTRVYRVVEEEARQRWERKSLFVHRLGMDMVWVISRERWHCLQHGAHMAVGLRAWVEVRATSEWVGWGKPSGRRQSSTKYRTSTSREKEDPGRSMWELLPITAWQLKSQGEALWDPNG